jgi:uncharacterized membrane protein
VIAFLFLLAVFAALHLLPRVGLDPPWLRSRRAKMRLALAAMLGLTSTSHFTNTEAFLQMIPALLPLRREAVYLSGLAEAAGAVGLLVPRLRRPAGLGVAALLVAVFPANVYVAATDTPLAGSLGFPGGGLWSWIRLLLQPAMIWAALWASAEGNPAASGATVPRRARGEEVPGAERGRDQGDRDGQAGLVAVVPRRPH